MKFLIIFLISLFSLSVQAQKTDHPYKTDSVFIMDHKSYDIKSRKAEVINIIFTHTDSSRMRMTYAEGVQTFTVINREEFLKKINGGYFSSYTVQEYNTKKLMVMILLFDETELIGVTLSDARGALVMKIDTTKKYLEKDN